MLIDTCATERRTLSLVDSVTSTTGSAVRTLVNTHHHGDHTNGNFLVPGATVVGHRKTREAILATGLNKYEGVFTGNDWGHLELRPPEVVFDDRLTIHAGDVRIDLIHPGYAAHTTNDVLVWLPEQRVLFAGDTVFNGGSPFAVMGSVADSRAVLDVVRSLEPLTIVPGHGPVCDLKALDRLDAYLAFVQERAEIREVRRPNAVRDGDPDGPGLVRRTFGVRAAAGEPAPRVRRAGRARLGRRDRPA